MTIHKYMVLKVVDHEQDWQPYSVDIYMVLKVV